MWPRHSCFDNTTSQLDWFGQKMYHQQRKRQDHKTNIDEYYFQVQKKTGWPHCSAALAPKTLLWPWLLLPSHCSSGTITRSPDQSRVGLTRRWPRDCAGPTAPRPVLGPWVALGRALATSLKPTLPPPILALAKGLCDNL